MSLIDNPRDYPLTNENQGNPNTALNLATKAISQDVQKLIDGEIPTGAQQLAIPDSNGTEADNARVCNALLALARSRGEIATS